MAESVETFYNHLAEDYHLIFADWRASVVSQGETLDRFIREQTRAERRSILDCSCGIGTQAIGLALKGHQVHATDISSAAVLRAQQEARVFNVPVTFAVADFRTLDRAVPGTYDIVLSCDNAVPHLMTDTELLQATRSMLSKLKPDGLLLLAVRNYDELIEEKPRFVEPRVIDDATGRRIVFQVWDWDESGRSYTLNHYIVRELHGVWHTSHRATQYRALTGAALMQTLLEAGFSDIEWHRPEKSGYVLPIVTARPRGRLRSYDEQHTSKTWG